MNPFLHTKGDIRVQSFSGSDADWDSLRLEFEAYTALPGMGDYMDAAKNEINPIDNTTLSQDGSLSTCDPITRAASTEFQ